MLFVSTDLESPEVIVCVPWPFPQVVVRERIQQSPVLTVISWNNTYDMGVRTHDDSGVMHRDTSPLAVGDDTGDKVNPAIEVES